MRTILDTSQPRLASAVILLVLIISPGLSYALYVSPAELPFNQHGGGQVLVSAIIIGVPSGGVLLAGEADPSSLSVLFYVSRDSGAGGDPDSLFTVSVDSGPDLFASPRNTPVAAGWLPGPHTNILSAHETSEPGWSFDLEEPLLPGQRTDVLFASFDTLPVGDLLVFAVPVCELVSDVLQCQALVTSTTVVPEPDSFLLLGLGLLLLYQVTGTSPARRLTRHCS